LQAKKVISPTNKHDKILEPNQLATRLRHLSQIFSTWASYLFGNSKESVFSIPFSSKERKMAIEKIVIVEKMLPKIAPRAENMLEDARISHPWTAFVKLSKFSKTGKPSPFRAGATFSKYWGKSWENCWIS